MIDGKAILQKSILQKSIHKDLSIIFTNNLQWSEHYKTIAAKAYNTLGLQWKSNYVYLLLDLRCSTAPSFGDLI